MKSSTVMTMGRIVLSIIAIMFLINVGALHAEETSTVQMLKTTGNNPELTLSHPTLYITKNTVVIWMNGVKDEELQVSFRDGKTTQDLSFSPAFKSFCLDQSSCFVTSFIPYAATSSLQFTKPGTFNYSVSNLKGTYTAKGTIIVRDM
jgi:hypothetical protein